MTFTDEEKRAIKLLAAHYEICQRDCIPEGNPCEIAEDGDCIVMRAYLLAPMLDRVM